MTRGSLFATSDLFGGKQTFAAIGWTAAAVDLSRAGNAEVDGAEAYRVD
jgi:hypothetical protein